MPGVLFIQNLFFQNLGPMYLSSILKNDGFKVKMLITNKFDSVSKNLDGIDVNIVAFSCTTGEHISMLEWAREIKSIKQDIFIIMGGAHPTFYPEVLSQEAPLDAICRGEGEYAILELCRCFPNIDKISDIPNLGVKTENGIKLNKMRPLCYLDTLPFPDRSLYGNRFYHDIQPVLSSRGCPYSCSFCFNNSFRKLIEEETKRNYFVRHRSPDNVIEELEKIKSISKVIQFRDESFLTNKEWLESFLKQYSRKIKLPFTCQIRINEVDEDLIRLLKASNIYAVFFGIESGNEEIRNKIVNKKVTTQSIYKGASLLRKYNIPFRTYNILGFPGETLEDAYSTARLNQEIKTNYPWVSMLMPYKETEIYKYFEEHYEIDTLDALEWFFPKSKFYHNKKELVNLHNLFILYVKFPFLKYFIKFFISLPPNFIYQMIFKVSYSWSSYKSEGGNLIQFIRQGLYNSLKHSCRKSTIMSPGVGKLC